MHFFYPINLRLRVNNKIKGKIFVLHVGCLITNVILSFQGITKCSYDFKDCSFSMYTV